MSTSQREGDYSERTRQESEEPATTVSVNSNGGDQDGGRHDNDEDENVKEMTQLISALSIEDIASSTNVQYTQQHDGAAVHAIHVGEAVVAVVEAPPATLEKKEPAASEIHKSPDASEDIDANSPKYPASIAPKETSTMTGIFFDERCLLHQANFGHVECPERLLESYKLIVQEGLWDRCVHFRLKGREYSGAQILPEQAPELSNPELTPEDNKSHDSAKKDTTSLAREKYSIPPLKLHPLSFPAVPVLSMSAIQKTHSASQVKRVEESSHHTYKDPEPDSETEGDVKLYPDCQFIDGDTYLNQYSAVAARIAATGPTEVTRRVLRGELKNGFSLTRPPGHHASPDRSSGFCLFNNVSVAAQTALREFPEKCRRIMIIDFDVHHGNGTQECFWSSREVLFFSIHRFGNFYPGTGSMREVGDHNARGYTVNVPFPGPAGDKDYIEAFKRIVLPLLKSHAPQLVLFSAGFDCLVGDPLGQMNVTPLGVGHLVQMTLKALPSDCAAVGVLEGGYSPNAVAEGVKWVMKAFLGDELPPLSISQGSDQSLTNSEQGRRNARDRSLRVINEVCEYQKKFWPLLGDQQ